MNWQELDRIIKRILVGQFTVEKMDEVILEKGKPVEMSEFSSFLKGTVIRLVDLQGMVVQYGTRGSLLASATYDAKIRIVQDEQQDRQGILKCNIPDMTSMLDLDWKLAKVLRNTTDISFFPENVAVSIRSLPWGGDIYLSLKEVLLEDTPEKGKAILNFGYRTKNEINGY